MTGFGRGRATVAGRPLVVEVRSVNHRFLEVKQRTPWAEPAIEQHVAQAVRRRLDRGAVTVTVRDEAGEAGAPAPSPLVTANLELARAFARALADVRAACAIEEPVSLALVAAQPGVLVVGGTGADPDALWAELGPGVEAALAALVAARATEGQSLAAELGAQRAELGRLVGEIAAHAADVADELRRRLTERLGRLGPTLEVDPQRLAQEVALYADRADIAEEIARLGAHLEEIERLLGEGGAIGRRLEFLAQELHREVNTIGAKSARLEVSQRVIAAKVCVERIREQVANVE